MHSVPNRQQYLSSSVTWTNLKVGPTKPPNFLAFLKTWKGAWMWNNIVNEGVDLCWVVYALTSGTAIWVTNGTLNHPIAPLVSGAEWLDHVLYSHKKDTLWLILWTLTSSRILPRRTPRFVGSTYSSCSN